MLGIDLFFLAATAGIIAIPSPGNVVNRQLDLTYEANLATWYSSIQLFAAGLIAILNAREKPYGSKLNILFRTGWVFIALVLVGISADEISQVHEQIATLYNQTRGPEMAAAHVGAGDWITFLAPLIVGVPLVMVLFFSFFSAERKLSLALAVAGLVCWIGSIYAESIEEHSQRFGISRQTQGAIEEGLEVFGGTLLLMSFVEFLIGLKTTPPAPELVTDQRLMKKVWDQSST
ncbi:MAG: hypothetical protein WAU45_02405 [Blastocatellia bacterium]